MNSSIIKFKAKSGFKELHMEMFFIKYMLGSGFFVKSLLKNKLSMLLFYEDIR